MKYMSLVLYTSYLHSHCAALPSKLHWGPPFSPHVALPPHALLPPLREQYIYHSLPPPDNWHLTDEDSADSFWLFDHRWCPKYASGGHLTVLPQDDNSIRSQSLLPPSNSFTASLHLAAFRAPSECVWDPGHLLFSPPPLFFLLWMEFHLSRRETFAELSWRVMGGDRSLSRHFRYDTFSLIWAVLTVLCVVCSGLRLKFYCSASRFRWQMFVCIPR